MDLHGLLTKAVGQSFDIVAHGTSPHVSRKRLRGGERKEKTSKYMAKKEKEEKKKQKERKEEKKWSKIFLKIRPTASWCFSFSFTLSLL
jgi:hypothetical protein